MNRAVRLWRSVLCGVLLAAVSAGVGAQAQKSAVPARVVETVDDTKIVTLSGNVHPLARAAYDQGAVPDSQPMTRMLLLLQRSSAQEQSLKQLIDAQQTKNSGNYHTWLTPEQFGQQYGPADSDVQAVTDWLTRSGFQVSNVAKGKGVIEFNGTVGQVRSSLHTEIHKFVVNGEEHFANVSDPAIPEALAPVVAGVAALHNFQKHPAIVQNGTYRRYQGSKQLQPLFTFGNPALYAIGPGDFAKIYHIPPTGATGAGQSIAIIAQTNINTQDVVNFRSMFGLPAYSSVCTSTLPPTCQFSVILNGPDPGIVGPGTPTDDEIESDLDTQWAGAVAPAANIYLIVSETTLSNPTQVSQGVDLSALYAVDNNVAPIISDSYGACEASLGTAGNQFYNSLWEQAAAQGITVAVAAGDDGSAGCDPVQSIDPDAATQGIAVNGIASTPYNVAVGGTDFDPSTTGNATYWNTTSDTVTSALGYIPEIAWDNSACALAYPAPCSSVDTSSYAADISAGSGGPSNCITSTTNSTTGVTTCTKTNNVYGYPKPSYQAALTPADSVRDIPDVSFFASNGGPLQGGTGVTYVICQSDTNPQGSTTPTGASCNLNTPYADFTLVGGTSASTPAFAAVMALVDSTQMTTQNPQGRQGNANYVLYNLASADSNYSGGACVTSNAGTPQLPNQACVFNDINKGNNAVACDSGTANCSNQTAFGSGQYGVLICNTATNANTPAWQTCPNADNGVPAFQSSTKYDLATGLGSINVGNLLNKWTSAVRTATTTTLTSASGGSPSGTNFTAAVAVSPAPANGEPVSLIALGTGGNVLGSYGPFALSGGTATVTTNLLPPGTTSVEGSFGGDATLAASTSSPVTLPSAVSGANMASSLTVYFVSLNTGVITTSAQKFPYGSSGYILRIVVTGPNSAAGCSFSYPNTKPAIPCPTGTVSLFDNGSPLSDFKNNMATLNNQGFAEDQPINVNAGSHQITAKYSGDQNYSAASSVNTLSVTLTQVTTQTAVTSSLSSITSGSSVVLTAVVSTTSGGNPPTGTVTFTSSTGGSLGAPTCTGTAATSTTGAYCTATLTTTISALYPPPTGNPGAPNIPRIPAALALLSLILFALGLRWIPQSRRRAYACLGLIAVALMVGFVAGCGGGGGGGSSGSTRTITAAYSGDTNYTKSSGTTTITVQ
jgi:Pro-kumamolisin, activation domain/Bacterial Ig-like domain (group 3)